MPGSIRMTVAMATLCNESWERWVFWRLCIDAALAVVLCSSLRGLLG